MLKLYLSKNLRIYCNGIIGYLVKLIQMILKVFVVNKMPPFTTQKLDTKVVSFPIAVMITKTVKTCLRVVQCRVELEA